MPRTRSIKPEAFNDRTLARVPPVVRWLYAGLWTFANDHGVGRAIPRELAGYIFPHDADIREEDVARWLDDLADLGRIALFMVGEERFFEVVKFARHQHPQRPGIDALEHCNGHERFRFTRASNSQPDLDSVRPSASVSMSPSMRPSASVQQVESGVRSQETGHRKQENLSFSPVGENSSISARRAEPRRHRPKPVDVMVEAYNAGKAPTQPKMGVVDPSLRSALGAMWTTIEAAAVAAHLEPHDVWRRMVQDFAADPWMTGSEEGSKRRGLSTLLVARRRAERVSAAIDRLLAGDDLSDDETLMGRLRAVDREEAMA